LAAAGEEVGEVHHGADVAGAITDVEEHIEAAAHQDRGQVVAGTVGLQQAHVATEQPVGDVPGITQRLHRQRDPELVLVVQQQVESGEPAAAHPGEDPVGPVGLDAVAPLNPADDVAGDPGLDLGAPDDVEGLGVAEVTAVGVGGDDHEVSTEVVSHEGVLDAGDPAGLEPVRRAPGIAGEHVEHRVAAPTGGIPGWGRDDHLAVPDPEPRVVEVAAGVHRPAGVAGRDRGRALRSLQKRFPGGGVADHGHRPVMGQEPLRAGHGREVPGVEVRPGCDRQDQ